MDSSIIAAIVSGFLAIVGTILAMRLKGEEQHENKITSALATQLTGWDNFSRVLRQQITDLQKEAEDCNERVERQNKTIDALRDEIGLLRREIVQLTYSTNKKNDQH